MSDTGANQFLSQFADATERVAFVPSPPTFTPSSSMPLNGYLAYQQDDGSTWAWDQNIADWVQTNAAGSGTVTNTGTLTDHAVIVGNGTVDVSALASLGTAGFVLTSNGAGVDPSFQASAASASPFIATGRLTLESGVPISTTDQLSKTTIYYTPYIGAQIALFDGVSAWTVSSFTERSLALGTLTSGKNYDVFIYDNSGTLTLEFSAAWSSDTTRTDAISLQDGIYVKTGATTRRLVGTFRTISTTATADSGGIAGTSQVGGTRYVWNYQNQVPRTIKVIDTTNSWSYTTASWRQANNASGNKFEWVQGLAGQIIDLRCLQMANVASNSANAGRTAIGYDTTSGPTGQYGNIYNNGSSLIKGIAASFYNAPGALGYHFAAWMEYGGAGTMDWIGDDGGEAQCGMNGVLWL